MHTTFQAFRWDESLIVTWPVSFPKERGVVSSLAQELDLEYKNSLQSREYPNLSRLHAPYVTDVVSMEELDLKRYLVSEVT